MTESDVIKLVAYKLGNISGQDDVIKSAIYTEIEALEQGLFHPWFLLSENNYYTILEEERRVPVPADFLAEYEEGALFAFEGEVPKVLTKKPQDWLRETYSYEGFPLHYALTNFYFRLYPQADIGTKLELLYYRKTAAVKGDENPWLKEVGMLIVYAVCVHMSLARKDKQVQAYQQFFQQEYSKMVARHTEREEANREAIFGGEY